MHFLLQLLNITALTMEGLQLQELNLIVNAAQNRTNIQTVALFGEGSEIEPYIRVLLENHTPKIVVTRNYGEINFHHEMGINKNIFFIAAAPLEDKALWNHMNNAFRGLQGHVSGVFITTHSKRKNSRINLRAHFEWCWAKGFTNALVLVDNENIHQPKFEIYNYNHFLKAEIINMTYTGRNQELFPDKFRNMHRFKIRTAAQFDPPRVFESSKVTVRNKKRLFGYVAALFQAFLKEYNADMDLLYYGRNRSYNIMEIIQRVENDEIDLGLNPYVPYKDVFLSYPLRMLQRCIVVPFPDELSKYKFFILPFQTKVWLSFLATWFVLSMAKLFGWFLKYKKFSRASTDVGQVFLDVWRLMMYLPSSTLCCYKNLKWFNALWFSFIAIMGFIFSNLYMASLTSYFSGLTFKPFTNTLAELIERRVFIDAFDYEIPAIINNRDLPKDFAELLRPRKGSDLLNDIIALKSNYSYAALEDRIQFAFNQQIHLLQPISHKVQECLTTMPLGFILPPHSQFERSLNRFILRSAAAGLIDKWILDSIKDGYYSGVLSMRIPKLEVSRPLTLKHFQFGWFVLAGGYVIGTLVFLFENLQRILKRFKIFIMYY